MWRTAIRGKLLQLIAYEYFSDLLNPRSSSKANQNMVLTVLVVGGERSYATLWFLIVSRFLIGAFWCVSK